MAITTYYGLKELGPGDQLADNGFAFGVSNIETIDRELHAAATHHHGGTTSAGAGPAAAPTVSLVGTQGQLAPGTRYYYRYTFIDVFGNESLPSPEGFIDTEPQVDAPAAPGVTTSLVGGTLNSGTYFYVLTAYDSDSGHETLAENATLVDVTTGSTNTNTVTFPPLPANASGFNLYRQEPSSVGYFFLATMPMNVATPPSQYVDDGSVEEDCHRTIPLNNTTNLDQSIQVCIGGATPTIPAGDIWRIYRTAVSGNYSVSLLKTITTPQLCYVDTGADTSVGAPPSLATGSSLDKILLTNAAEVRGVLPPAQLTYRDVVRFVEPGTLAGTKAGTFAWLCPYERAQIQYVVASLGRGSSPASTAVIVDVNKFDANIATPVWSSIFGEDSTLMPTINVGTYLSLDTVPTIVTLLKGDLLTVDIDQVGGGATPTDNNLLVQVILYYQDTTATSIVFA